MWSPLKTGLIFLNILNSPLNLILLLFLYAYKSFVVFLSKIFEDFVAPIPGSSSIFITDKIHEKPSISIIVGVELQKEDGKVSKESITAVLQRLYDLRDENGLRCYRELGYYPVVYGGYGFWKECPDFKVSDQVEYLEEMREEKVAAIVDNLIRKPYEMGRPLWNFYIVQNYNNDEKKSMGFFRFHHMLADGMSIVKFFYATFGFNCLPPEYTKPKNSVERWDKLSSSFWAKCEAMLKVAFAGVPDYADQLLLTPERNRLNFDEDGNISYKSDWICSLGKRLELEEVKRAGRAMGGSALHVMLTGVAGGLIRYFRKYFGDEAVPKEVNFVSSIPFPNHPDLRLVNHWALARIKLPLDSLDARETFQDMKEQVRRSALGLIPMTSGFMFKYTSALLPTGLIQFFSKAKATNTSLMSNVVGPQEKGYFGDAAVTDMYFWMPISQETTAIAIAIMSCNGGIRVCLTADIGAVPDRCHLDDLGLMMYEEIKYVCQLSNN